MNTRKAMSEAIAVLDAPGSQGVGRTMYLKTRWTKVEEPSRQAGCGARSLGTARAESTSVFSVSFVIRMSARCSRKPARTV